MANWLCVVHQYAQLFCRTPSVFSRCKRLIQITILTSLTVLSIFLLVSVADASYNDALFSRHQYSIAHTRWPTDSGVYVCLLSA